MSAEVDEWFAKDRPFQEVLDVLRRMLLEFDLEETLKWRQPCYMVGGKNIAILSPRKTSCVLSLFNGALLADPDNQLTLVGPNTRSARNLHFTSVEEIEEREPLFRPLIAQSIALGRAGRRVSPRTTTDPVPDELVVALDADPELKIAFEALTPGRQRGYLLHFNAAKQSATRTSRIEESRPRILAGKGRHDCICGRSARMPRCDGSHRDAE